MNEVALLENGDIAMTEVSTTNLTFGMDDPSSIVGFSSKGSPPLNESTTERFGHGQPGRGRGRVIDRTGLIKQARLSELSSALAESNLAGGPEITVVLVRPAPGLSMETLGWAVAGKPSGRTVVILADPDSAKVRVEGDMAPEQKARVASTMQSLLRARQPELAIRAAITTLQVPQ